MKNTEPDKLAQDVHKAIMAGMSYGQWKAAQEPVKIERHGIPEGWKICAHCGAPFKPSSKRKQFYCGAMCTRQSYYEKHKERKEK